MASGSFSVLRFMWLLITSRQKCCRDRGLPGDTQTNVYPVVAWNIPTFSFFSFFVEDLKFYSWCQKSLPTRASSSRCARGWDRCWHGWRSPGASSQDRQPDVLATTPIQTHRTEREQNQGWDLLCMLLALRLVYCVSWLPWGQQQSVCTVRLPELALTVMTLVLL